MTPLRPTDLPTSYFSARLMMPHTNLTKVLSKLVHDLPDHCIYLHGHGTTNEHFHVYLSGSGKAHEDMLRKRIRDNFGLRAGNAGYSMPSFENGAKGFVFYCGHEGTEAIYSDARWADVISATTEYFVKNTGQSMLPLGKSTAKDPSTDWQLTYSNIVPKAINHARAYGLSLNFRDTVQHMLENTRWRPCYYMVQRGIPDHYHDDFSFRSGKRARMTMDWFTPKS